MALSLGLALSLPPLLTHEVLVQPTIALQAHHTALPPLPSPQLLTASAMGAPFLPLALAQHHPLHATPSPSGQSPGLAGAQHPLSPLPGTVLVQQLLFPNTTPYIAQHLSYPSTMHQQIQIPACMPQHLSSLHGYAGPHTSTPGGVMVDPEERYCATHTTYAVLALAAQSSPTATSDALLARMSDLERVLHQVQGTDR